MRVVIHAVDEAIADVVDVTKRGRRRRRRSRRRFELKAVIKGYELLRLTIKLRLKGRIISKEHKPMMQETDN